MYTHRHHSIVHSAVSLFTPVQGYVSDGNSYALGGISGHAGYVQYLYCDVTMNNTISHDLL